MLDLDVQTVKGAAIVGIVVLVVGGALLAAITALAQGWKRRYWRGATNRARAMWSTLNIARKMVVARKQTRLVARREFISLRRRAPLLLLRVTLFRWFEASPATDWPYIMRVFQDHSDDDVKAQAEALLWEVRSVRDLNPRDCIMEDQHVTLTHPCSNVVFVLTNVDSSGSSETRYTSERQARVKRGWCTNIREPGDSCRYCDLTDLELQQTADDLMAKHKCPTLSSPV